ncbi:AI-2E family transporter [Marivirga sp. S37H4]|uniref:AI-2E family transporter n=1 Tax=Marivirga aurantiaca TaxID=2802615 RepID=A0A935C614_9BACT|nr:AI-2E family transporter [Marivirga aurantiaca]MBK6264191.1 AI-2E family transporter [Marivirga aurantiaca]
MKINDLATTNRLLLILVIPVAFYILQVLSFIFIPLMFAIFIALLFTPMMRWMKKRKWPHFVSLIAVICILVLTFFSVIKVVQLSGKEIQAGKNEIFEKLDDKVENLVTPFSDVLGLEQANNQSTIKNILESEKVSEAFFQNFQITFTLVRHTVVNILMTLFFLILLLAGSMNFNDILRSTMSRGKTQSVKTFVKVERSISEFLKVKIFVSLLTGLAFGIIAWSLGISFPIFWGLFAFVVNFIQMVGSIIATIVATLFAFIELEAPGAILAALLLFTGAQVLFGSIMEPIWMGKSFSINIIVVLVMLMFWGFLWGVPGLILAIPLTVLMKTIMGEFEGTKKLAQLMS